MKKRVFFLFPGPKYDVLNEFRSRFEALSRHYGGYIVTSTPKPMAARLSAFDVRTSAFHKDSSLRSKFDYIRGAWLSALDARRRGPVDLVVAYDPLFVGLIGWAIARFVLGARFVVEINGDFNAPANYQHIRRRFVRAMRYRLNVAIVRFVVGRADGVKLLYREQIDWLGMSMKVPVRAYFDYTDISHFLATSARPEKQVLFIGFPFYVKGVDLLIEAFERVSERHGEWVLKIVGYYPPDSELFRLIEGRRNIVYEKPVPHSEVPAHLSRAAFLVLPSRTEAMGRVLLEAMASGRPCIGSRVGGIPSVIEDGVNGLLFESEDVDGLVRCMLRLIESEDLRASLGERGRAMALERFTVDRYVSLTDDFYRAVLGQEDRRDP